MVQRLFINIIDCVELDCSFGNINVRFLLRKLE